MRGTRLLEHRLWHAHDEFYRTRLKHLYSVHAELFSRLTVTAAGARAAASSAKRAKDFGSAKPSATAGGSAIAVLFGAKKSSFQSQAQRSVQRQYRFGIILDFESG